MARDRDQQNSNWQNPNSQNQNSGGRDSWTNNGYQTSPRPERQGYGNGGYGSQTSNSQSYGSRPSSQQDMNQGSSYGNGDYGFDNDRSYDNDRHDGQSAWGSSSGNQRGYGSAFGAGTATWDRGNSQQTSHLGKGPKGWTRSDERIRESACDALERSHDVDATEIEVDVKEGVVSLRGHVDSRQSKRAAEDCVHYLSGVKDVRNELVIDQSLFQMAKEAIFGDSDKSTG